MNGLLRIGESVPRYEDRRFLTGRGHYTADLRLHGEAHMAVVRSPHAAARIAGILSLQSADRREWSPRYGPGPCWGRRS